MTASFLSITGETKGVKLQEISPIGTDIPVGGELSIALLGSTGKSETIYEWVNNHNELIADGIEEGSELYNELIQKGWFTLGENKKEDITFIPGQGLWVAGMNATTSLQINGRVYGEETFVSLLNGKVATGNPFPTETALQKLTLTVDSEKNPSASIPVGGEMSIALLGITGKSETIYEWVNNHDELTADGIEEGTELYNELIQQGWFTLGENKKEDVRFAPGQGLWVAGTTEGIMLFFPKPANLE